MNGTTSEFRNVHKRNNTDCTVFLPVFSKGVCWEVVDGSQD